MKRCTQLADSLVTGEPLSDAERAHLARCADCARLELAARRVGATATAAEAGPGFSSRMVVGARARMATRRRNRAVGFGLATVVAAAATVLVVTNLRDRAAPERDPVVTRPAGDDPTPPAPGEPDEGLGDDAGITDDELRELVGDARLSRALAPTADWDHIEAPVRHYRAVLRHGGAP